MYHLNGSVKDYYDPYKNRIINNLCEVKDREQIVVPFILLKVALNLLLLLQCHKGMLNCMKNSKSVILLLLLDMVLMEMMVI